MTPSQSDRLRDLLARVLPRNDFYRRKYAGWDVTDVAHLPLTTKAELLADQADHPPYGSILTFPLAHYARMHQTSGTSGRPLRWLDTPESWSWMLDCWELMFGRMGIRADDRLFFPFSFGPFLGFWTGFEAATRRGLFCLAAGGLTSVARLRILIDNAMTVVFCTPTYALHLVHVAREQGIDLATSPVRRLVVAGEPGGSVPAVRRLLEQGWGARVYDHGGLTEVGPTTIEPEEAPGGLEVLADDYIAEAIDPATGGDVSPGELGELVLTNLGRIGSPVIRYRTGDLVRMTGTRLEGGILARCDDMIHVRGNNVFPAALESLFRRFPDLAEFRVEVDESGPLTSLVVEVEPVAAGAADLAGRVDRAIRDEFAFRADVRAVAPGSLPRYDMKARRFTRRGAPSPDYRGATS